jgi:CO/xanthine dehydrogenase FAD-binding subunit
VKPREFEYVRPTTVDDVLALLAERGDDAKLLAGGQSLVPMLNFRLTAPDLLIDLNHVASLRLLRRVDGWLRIGAMTRQSTLEASATAAESWPLLRAALRWVAHPPIRNRGTVGGSVAHADPAAELPVVLATLDAVFHVASARGRRSVPAAEFFTGNLSTVLETDDLLERIDVPPPVDGTLWAFKEFARRHGDFALGGAAATIVRDGERCARLRLGLMGAATVPVVADIAAAEGREIGSLAELDVTDEIGDLIHPTPDLHGDAQFRRRIVLAMAHDAVRDAAARATGEPLS